MINTNLEDMGLLPRGLMTQLRRNFRLDWAGIHGAPHWSRVMHLGLQIARVTGADTRVICLFAVLHDSERQNEGSDPDHGRRAAYAVRRRHESGALGLDDRSAELLAQACAGHSKGGLDVDPTIATCWDADRLDLGRVGVRPLPSRLCTSAARDPDLIEFAWRWSQGMSTSRIISRLDHGD